MLSCPFTCNLWQYQQLHWFSPDRSTKACLLCITSQYLSQEFPKYSPNILIRPTVGDVKNAGFCRKKIQPKSLSTVWGSVTAVSSRSRLWNHDSAWDLHLMPKRQNLSEPLPGEIREKLPSFLSCFGISETLNKRCPFATFLFPYSSLILHCSTAKYQSPCPRGKLPYISLSKSFWYLSRGFVALAQAS